MPNTERLEAIGSRGEACIIVRTPAEPLDGGTFVEASSTTNAFSYRLATGERLAQTDDARIFRTLDGNREYTLRH